MVSPSTAQPDSSNIVGSNVGNVNLIKASSNKLKTTDDSATTTTTTTTTITAMPVISTLEESNNINNGYTSSSSSSSIIDDNNINNENNNNDKLSINTINNDEKQIDNNYDENKTTSSPGSDTSTRKTPSSTPTQPTFNVWQVRQEAMNSKKAPELLNGNKDTNINNGNNGNYVYNHNNINNGINYNGNYNNNYNYYNYKRSDKPNYFSQNSSPEDSRRYYKKDSRRSKPTSQSTPAPIIPPLEDQNSWPAPAEVLIKDKEKEVNSESSEKKQSLPNELGLKKEESPKKGKGKWIPYEELTITHNPPLPGHDRPKTRRRSEDHAGYRDRRSSEKTPSPEARYQSSSSSSPHYQQHQSQYYHNQQSLQQQQPQHTNNSNGDSNSSSSSSSQLNTNNNQSKRRASVPPPLRDNSRRYFNYNESNQNGNHISYNGSSSYRGSRRGGRGRSYNGPRGISRSASFSYTTPIYNTQNYGNFYGTKIGVIYDIEILKYYVLQQIEYYFSIENLCKDIYLRNNMDSEGYVDISLLAGFNRVKALTLDEEIIREALLNSHIVEVKGDKVRKRDEWGFWLLPKQGDNLATENNINDTNDNNSCSSSNGSNDSNNTINSSNSSTSNNINNDYEIDQPKSPVSNNDPQNNIPYDNYSDLHDDNIALKNNVNGELINGISNKNNGNDNNNGTYIANDYKINISSPSLSPSSPLPVTIKEGINNENIEITT